MQKKRNCLCVGLQAVIKDGQKKQRAELISALVISLFISDCIIPYYETPSAHHHPVQVVQLIYLHLQPAHLLPEQ